MMYMYLYKIFFSPFWWLSRFYIRSFVVAFAVVVDAVIVIVITRQCFCFCTFLYFQKHSLHLFIASSHTHTHFTYSVFCRLLSLNLDTTNFTQNVWSHFYFQMNTNSSTYRNKIHKTEKNITHCVHWLREREREHCGWSKRRQLVGKIVIWRENKQNEWLEWSTYMNCIHVCSIHEYSIYIFIWMSQRRRKKQEVHERVINVRYCRNIL